MTTPSASKTWDTLQPGKGATGNHAIDRDAWASVPHLFFNLAVRYPVPPEFFLTVLFLWDKTVGQDREAPAGDCALSQIPVRPRDRARWLAALVTAGFWDCDKATPGGANQRGSFYEYKNPPAEAWERLFKAASLSRNMDGFDDITPARFGRMFARAVNEPGDNPLLPR
jgi:hypothetical protein